VTAEIEVHGDKVIRHKIDGQTVIEYEHPVLDLKDKNVKHMLDGKTPESTAVKSGWISLQAESHPLEFRKVEIKEIKD
jgi:hypothetical protein